ncbi:MAG: hypothetical protein ACKPEY_05145, partial [Planctomycetota bacterium]
MRLTLRTLLAYLDDLLDPLDAVELGRRIDESKFATELVQRIRQRSKQPRLGAPKVDGRGIGLDANSVAEYLDNTLAADRVPEFEKVCLESDVHLSEVASCHHILALVLDKPATVSPALRNRAHRLISLSTSDFALPTEEPPIHQEWEAGLGHLAAGRPGTVMADHSVAGFPAAAGVGAGSSDDYLCDSHDPLGDAVQLAAQQNSAAGGPITGAMPANGTANSTANRTAVARKPAVGRVNTMWWGIGLALAIGAVAFTVPLATRWWNARSSTEIAAADGERGGSGGATAGKNTTRENIVRENTDTAAATDGEPNSAVANAVDERAAAGKLAGDAGDEGDAAASGLEGASREAMVGPGARTPSNGNKVAGNNDAGINNARNSDAGNSDAASDPADKARPAAAALGGADKRKGDLAAEPGRGGTLLGGRPPAPAIPPLAGDANEEAADGIVGTEVARMASENQVLARVQATDELWYRVPRGGKIVAGERLVSLPVYRPQLILKSGAQLLLVGEAALELSAASDQQAGAVQVHYGRLLLTGAGHPGLRLQLNLGGVEGQLRLLEADTEVAIEVRRSLAAGSDPERDSAWLTVTIHARGGQAGWTLPGGGEANLAAGVSWRQSLSLPSAGKGEKVAGQAEVMEQSFPKWADPKAISKLDHDAAEQLEGFLAVQRPLTVGLEERVGFRKTEVRSLVARCLAELGSYDAVIGELGSDQQHAYWSVAVETLRLALSRAPETAVQVRESLVRLRHDDGQRLYRMLWEY